MSVKKYAPHGLWIFNIVLIFSLSVTGRDLLRWSQCCIDSAQIAWVLCFGFLALLSVVIYFLLQRSRSHTLRLLLPLGIVFIGFPFLIPTVEERLHLLLFSCLGFLCAHSLRGGFALAVALMCGVGDEVLQHFLVDRVGDWRDVLFNCGSALWGIFLYRVVLEYAARPPAMPANDIN